MNYLELFNQQFENLMNDLIIVFPDDGQLRFMHHSVKIILLTDEEYIYQVYHKYVTEPYSNQLMKREEEFFLDNNYEDIQGNMNDGINIIKKVKSYWKILSDKNKEIIWKYLQNMCVLTTKLIST